MFSPMIRSAALAAAGFWLMASVAHADQTVLKFWDNQQTESGLQPVSAGGGEALRGREPRHQGRGHDRFPIPEYQQRLLTAVQGGNAPDVSTVDQIWVAAFAEAGAIAPLDDRAKAAGVKADTFFKGAWESANYNGKLWGIPFNVDVW